MTFIYTISADTGTNPTLLRDVDYAFKAMVQCAKCARHAECRGLKWSITVLTEPVPSLIKWTRARRIRRQEPYRSFPKVHIHDKRSCSATGSPMIRWPEPARI
jgi:hypothetical protein